MVLRGLSEPYGFWNTICTPSRIRRRSASVTVAVGWPPSSRSPSLGGSRRAAIRARVDLPQPDSPTTASVVPRARVNDTPSTAFTTPRRPSRPPPTG